MPGRKIPLITGEYYHVFNRGVNKRVIFEDEKNYQRCLNQITYYKHQRTPIKFSSLIQLNIEIRQAIWNSTMESPQRVEIIAFCLMPNHFHFLLKQNTEGGIARFMSNFQNSYSRYFNIKTKRSGPLLTGKFKAVRIESEEQLLHVSRYIHLNPTTSYIVRNSKRLSKYKWSSLPEYLGKASNKICNKEVVLNSFKSKDDYLSFLSEHIDYQRELNYLKKLTS